MCIDMEPDLTQQQVMSWVNNDPELTKCLVEIQEMEISFEDQAEVAFHKLSDMFNLPKLPIDVQRIYDINEDSQELTSVYQMLGFLVGLSDDPDRRGHVLQAVYYIIHGYTIDVKDVIKEKFGRKKSEIVGVCFEGENSKVELVFVKKGESWLELGCNLFLKPL